MQSSVLNILPQGSSAREDMLSQGRELVKAWKTSLEKDELTRLETFKSEPLDIPDYDSDENPLQYRKRIETFIRASKAREKMARGLIKSMAIEKHKNDLGKAGVTTATGFNFYDLRAPLELLYPVNTPLRNMLPRVGPKNAGVGTTAHWQATRNPGSPYAGIAEVERNQIGTPDNVNYLALYKELGMDRQVSMTAEWAGEGYADNLADEHIRGLQGLMLQEESMILLGNSGTASGNLGFALGTPTTPTTALKATHTTPGAAGNLGTVSGNDLPGTTILATTSFVSVGVVYLTGLGNPSNSQYGYGPAPTIPAGLSPTYTRTNADGTSRTYNGGMSAVSALSAPLQCTSGNLTVQASVAAADIPVKGCFGYAWFVDVEASSTNSLANAKFAGVTYSPFAYITYTPNGTQAANATGLNADHSFNALDFDGLFTFNAVTAGAYWKDLQGVTLTSEKDGRVTELENALQFIFDNYQAGTDEIWCSADAARALNSAVRYNGTTSSAFMFLYQRDAQNNMLGGYVVSAYQSMYAVNAPMGSTAIPIKIHPMIPKGTIYLMVKTNPYPQSRAPFVQGMMVQHEYYSIEWPQTQRAWPFGTYVHEVLAHHTPWIAATITGIPTFAGN